MRKKQTYIWHVVLCLRRVHFTQEKSSLRAAVFSVDVAGHRETGLQNVPGIIHRGLEELFEVFIFG